MMHLSRTGLDLICKFESFSKIIYVCPAGYPTIGYGHLITEKNKEQFLDGVDEDEGVELLKKDVLVAERAVMRLIKAPLTQGEFDALVSFTFNLGAGALQRSTLRLKLNRGEYDAVPAEFLKWVCGGGRKLKGLVVRRRAEAIMFSA